jgi:hypothetical protein
MSRRMGRLVLLGVLAVAATSALAPGAQASVAPSLTLDQSAGTTAGSSANLGVDLKFSSTAGDSPKQLTMNLPPGLLANASINGGACLASADLEDSACEVGSGVVTANLLGTIPVPAQVTFDLVPPPAPGDLAGLAVNSNGTQIGTTGDIRIRPSGDPAGVGVTLNLTLPNSLSGTPISITEISSTFDSLRYPATCPATPQNFSATVDSYNDPTLQTVAAPLSVTGCSALFYAPAFSVAAVRDRADQEVSLSTTLTQAATESPSQSVSLAFPSPTLVPNIKVAGALCVDPASGTCTPVGSATASSPLYPRALTGQAYLTGTILGPSLTLVFPPPFPLTLSGRVDLIKNTATFTGLPDIPLTNLTVSLNPGPEAVFQTTCKPPTNTATATLTNQNGDHTVTVPAKFTVAGCAGGAGSGKGNGGGSPVQRGKAKGITASIAGLSTGHPSLTLRVRAAKGAPGLRRVAIALPNGLGFITHRVGKRIVVGSVQVRGGRGVTFSLSHGHLVITLRKPAAKLLVRLGSHALKESRALKRKARAHRLPRLFLSLVTTNATGKRTAIRVHLVTTAAEARRNAT